MTRLQVTLAFLVIGPGSAFAQSAPAPAPAPIAAPAPTAAPIAAPAPAPAPAPVAAPVAAPAPAQAQVVQRRPQPPPHKLPRRSVSLGAGLLTSAVTAGSEDNRAYALSGDWRPLPDRLWGLRAQYLYTSTEDGTSLVNSKRSSHLLALQGMRHYRATGSLYFFGGAGLGAAAVYTSHNVGESRRSGLALRPALSWTAGIEIPFERIVLRLDGTGLWHEISHDRLYAVRIGMRF